MDSKYDNDYWRDRIDEVMDYFDFDRVHRCMVALNWQWASCEGVPDKPELKREARKLLRGCVDRNMGGSGGFRLDIDRDEGWLSLSFVVEEWSAEV